MTCWQITRRFYFWPKYNVVLVSAWSSSLSGAGGAVTRPPGGAGSWTGLYYARNEWHTAAGRRASTAIVGTGTGHSSFPVPDQLCSDHDQRCSDHVNKYLRHYCTKIQYQYYYQNAWSYGSYFSTQTQHQQVRTIVKLPQSANSSLMDK